MEFNGAVVVSNEKIKKALENYEYLNKKYLQLYEEIKEELLKDFDTLSWWVKIFNEDDKVDCVLENKYGESLNRIFFNDYWEIFCKHNLISEKDFNLYRCCDVWSGSRDRVIIEGVKSLVQAGEPVYLNIEQSTFVNTFEEK